MSHPIGRPRRGIRTLAPRPGAWIVGLMLLSPGLSWADAPDSETEEGSPSEDSGSTDGDGSAPESGGEGSADESATTTESTTTEPAADTPSSEPTEASEETATEPAATTPPTESTETSEDTAGPPTADTEANEPAESVVASDSGDKNAEEEGEAAADTEVSPLQRPRFQLHLYADLGLQFDDEGDSFATRFLLGDITLQGRAELGPKMDGLAEFLFEMSPDRAPLLRVGRLFGRYALHPLATIKVGRFHSPIGFFLTHEDTRAPLFWLTPDTARLLALSSDESMVHTTMEGGELSGAVTLGKVAELSYNVAGGIAHGLKPVVVGRIALAPKGPLTGLETGATVSVHRGSSSAASGLLAFSTGTEQEDDSANADEQDLFSTMVVGHVAYNSSPIEAAIEVYYVHNSEQFAGEGHDLFGAWGQLGVTIKRLTPFTRYEYWKRDEADSFYNNGSAPIEWNELMVGARLALSPQVALTGSYSHRFHDNTNVGLVQVALGF